MIEVGTVLAVFPRSDNEKLVVEWREFKGRPYLDIRQHYKSEDAPHYRDGLNVGWKYGKGATIRTNELVEFHKAVERVRQEMGS